MPSFPVETCCVLTAVPPVESMIQGRDSLGGSNKTTITSRDGFQELTQPYIIQIISKWMGIKRSFFMKTVPQEAVSPGWKTKPSGFTITQLPEKDVDSAG